MRLPFCLLKEAYYLNPYSNQSDGQGSQLVSEPCPASFGEPQLAPWCLVEVSLCVRWAGLAGAWQDSSPNEPGVPRPGDKEVKNPSPNPRLVTRIVVMKYHRLELSPSKGSLFSLYRSQYYGTVSLQKQWTFIVGGPLRRPWPWTNPSPHGFVLGKFTGWVREEATSWFESMRSVRLLLCRSKWSFCLLRGTCFFTDTFTSYALHGGFWSY
jgi:hypothetical protein